MNDNDNNGGNHSNNDNNIRGSILAGKFQDKLIFKIIGHGCFSLGPNLQETVDYFIERGVQNIFVDLKECTYMDSTFIGTLCKSTMTLEKLFKKKLNILNISEDLKKNLESMGILRFMNITQLEYNGDFTENNIIQKKRLNPREISEHILDAHLSLVQANKENSVKFHTVIQVLRDELKA